MHTRARSVWALGSDLDAAHTRRYAEPAYDDDGNASCAFSADSGISFVDVDFLEVAAIDAVHACSHADAFAAQIADARAAHAPSARAIVLAYDFDEEPGRLWRPSWREEPVLGVRRGPLIYLRRFEWIERSLNPSWIR